MAGKISKAVSSARKSFNKAVAKQKRKRAMAKAGSAMKTAGKAVAAAGAVVGAAYAASAFAKSRARKKGVVSKMKKAVGKKTSRSRGR